MKKLATTLTIALLALAAAGQELEKEITIEREIVPELRAATRLNIYPRLQKPEIAPVALRFNDLTQWGQLTPMLRQLEPAWAGAAETCCPWRGFVKGAYATEKNAALEAGFRAVDTERTRLDLGIEGSYTDYRRLSDLFEERLRVKRLEAGAKAGLTHLFDGGRLTVDTRLRFSRINHPAELSDPLRDALDWRLGAKWEGRSNSNGLSYEARGNYGLFNFGRLDKSDTRPMGQHAFAIGGSIIQSINSHQAAGIDLTGDFLNFNHYGTVADKGRTQGYIAARPRWVFDNGTVSARVGLRADVAFNSGAYVRVAPDILAGFNPQSWLGIALRLGGGERLNPLSELYREAPCFSPYLSYGMSRVPFEGSLKLRLGPFNGVALELGADYAAADKWLMPIYAEGLPAWSAGKQRSAKIGARLSWQYRRAVELAAGFEGVLTEGARGDWYLWRDRSRQRLEAEAVARPIDKLTIKLGYSRRMSRRMTWFDGTATHLTNLRDYDNLSAEAAYEVLRPLRVFIAGDNLLDSRSMEPFGIPCQGISGRIGLTYRF